MTAPVVTTDLLPSAAITRLTDDFLMEKRQFCRDVAPDDAEERPEIDRFRYRRYLVLGWIRQTDYPPYYVLTTNGENIALYTTMEDGP